MALLADYTAGTISVAEGETTVTGDGVAWKTAGFREGDIFIAAGYWAVVAADLEDEDELVLVDWAGPTLSGAPYRLRYMSDGSRASAQARQLIDLLGGSGSLEALAALVGAPNTIPYFTGAGTMGLLPLEEVANAVNSVPSTTTIDDIVGFASLDGKDLKSMGPFADLLANALVAAPQRIDELNLGHASDTTLTRAAAGQIAVEGSRVFQRNNILGTVSQVGGIPTGAVIESGSNANGAYVKFADGTMIGRRTTSVAIASLEAAGSVWRNFNAAGAWTFPAAFIETPQVFVMTTSSIYWVSIFGPLTVSGIGGVVAFCYTNAPSTIPVGWYAIGRWF